MPFPASSCPAPWPGTGPGALVTAPLPPPARQCPARPRGRWRRRRSTPQPSECCGARPRPAGSTGRSAATRSTMCAWRAPRPAGHRASRTSCWQMPRWAGAAWVAGAPGHYLLSTPHSAAGSPLTSFLSLPPPPPAQWEMDDTAEYVSSFPGRPAVLTVHSACVWLPTCVPACPP